jgi:hypothetical protein
MDINQTPYKKKSNAKEIACILHFNPILTDDIMRYG